MSSVMPVRRALISVSDKSGVAVFAAALAKAGVAIISTGSTAKHIADAGIAVAEVAQVTGAPEMLDGRVKTLHPTVHGGILADRHNPEHMKQIAERGIEPIDLVVVNLYPFKETVARPGVTEDEAIENIDIGGPTMVRSAAKNFHSVGVVVNPADYDEVAGEIQETGGLSEETRRALCRKAFAHTAAYDAIISTWLEREERFPVQITPVWRKLQDLRYGENPHQGAAFYRDVLAPEGCLADAIQIQGKELSYNNLFDVDGAWNLVREFGRPAVAIIKHSNPCGVSVAAGHAEAYRRAFECDPTSAFGGIVAVNGVVDAQMAEAISKVFTECVIAPDYSPEALEAFAAKKNVRVLKAPLEVGVPERSFRWVSGGVLVTDVDLAKDPREQMRVAGKIQPSETDWEDLLFAWTVVKHVKSNAIVLANDLTAVGVGAGQMSRIESVQLAAKRAGGRAAGTVGASEAFFPFRDGLDAMAAAGVRAIIEPGGSVRDDEVIAAADEHGIPLVFTGRRHFRH
ncbi:MAG: bifunctional phosphoribosylaminoimidazolecarboxamide formyltransferase/IMP cyclohydrolase [Actinomycetota bacterium]